ncbi:MAG: hypothetical protein R3208_11455 [Ketobacteraceae bacterium]|nr:hypothetical protein [Ketobacteraceae bacterium]
MSEWDVDIIAERAKHVSGVEIIFSGNPDSNNFDGKPTGFPSGMTAIEQVTLIRTGFEAYRAAYQQNAKAKPKTGRPAGKPKISTKPKSNRPVISLNR